jgi:hypothetical protein
MLCVRLGPYGQGRARVRRVVINTVLDSVLNTITNTFGGFLHACITHMKVSWQRMVARAARPECDRRKISKFPLALRAQEAYPPICWVRLSDKEPARPALV